MVHSSGCRLCDKAAVLKDTIEETSCTKPSSWSCRILSTVKNTEQSCLLYSKKQSFAETGELSIVTTPKAGQPTNHGSITDRDKSFSIPKVSRLALGIILPPFQWVHGALTQAVKLLLHSPPSCGKVICIRQDKTPHSSIYFHCRHRGNQLHSFFYKQYINFQLTCHRTYITTVVNEKNISNVSLWPLIAQFHTLWK
jgi:hypothetical protein